MIRKVVLFASLSVLASCATHSSLPAVEQPRPLAVNPKACVPPRDEPLIPADAALPQPVGRAEQAAADAFLGWVGELLDWGRQSADTARSAQAAVCHHQ